MRPRWFLVCLDHKLRGRVAARLHVATEGLAAVRPGSTRGFSVAEARMHYRQQADSVCLTNGKRFIGKGCYFTTPLKSPRPVSLLPS